MPLETSRRKKAMLDNLLGKRSFITLLLKKIFTFQNTFLLYVIYLVIKTYKLNVDSKDLWLDESGQYWISQGQNHFSNWNEISGNLLSVIDANRQSNLDPGGFSILLRLWTDAFGSQLASQRTLSFVFWIGSLFLSIYLSNKVLRTKALKVVSSCLIALVFFSNSVRWYAFEIRAYSMSLFGALLIILALLLILERESIPRIIFFVFATLFLVISRYPGVIFTAAACLVVIMFFLKQRKIRTAALLVVPIGIFQIFLYCSTTRFQNSGNPPSYVEALLLKNATKEFFMKTLRDNWIDGFGLFVGAGIFASFIYLWFRLSTPFVRNINQFRFLVLYFLVCQFLLMSFSTLGLLPWNLKARWSLNDYSLVVLSIIILMSLFESGVLAGTGWIARFSNRSNRFILVIPFLLLSFLLLMFQIDRNWVRTDGRNVLKPLMDKACLKSDTFLDSSIYPDARYFVKIDKSGLELRSNDMKRFDLFKDEFVLDNQSDLGYKITDCLVMSQNWDTQIDAKNRIKLLEIGFFEVREYPREFGGLGWILFKKLI